MTDTTEKKNHTIMISVTHHEWEALQAIANDDFRSVRSQVKLLVMEAIQDWEDRDKENV